MFQFSHGTNQPTSRWSFRLLAREQKFSCLQISCGEGSKSIMLERIAKIGKLGFVRKSLNKFIGEWGWWNTTPPPHLFTSLYRAFGHLTSTLQFNLNIKSQFPHGRNCIVEILFVCRFSIRQVGRFADKDTPFACLEYRFTYYYYSPGGSPCLGLGSHGTIALWLLFERDTF